MSHIQKITVLGATGSIGASTLDVVARHPDRYQIYALTAHRQIQKLAALCVQFRPAVAVVADGKAADDLDAQLRTLGLHNIEIKHGPEALCEVAQAPEVDAVMAAIVGAAGLPASLAAAKAGKTVLLANKEALVMSGDIFMRAIKQSGARILPIDSEHNAIFQCLPSHYDRNPSHHAIHRILLTASGGPFLKRELSTFGEITPEQAVAHPNWVMGRKISVDSATMMNKGLEVIEAHWLFGATADQIEVVIHPESVIHSMVSYQDGSVLAQMGNPDMRIPIAYGLAYPERIDSGVEALDLMKVGQLNFMPPDFQRFPCLSLCFQALRTGGSAPTVLNASNEIAVQAFLDGRIGYQKIHDVIAHALSAIPVEELTCLDAILDCDHQARLAAEKFIQ